MKLLRIDDHQGFYLDESNNYVSIDKVTKEDLLRLVDRTLAEDAEFDEYDGEAIKNPAHQILYKSIYEKLSGIKGQKEEFIDESGRIYLTEYEKYREAPSQSEAAV